MEDKIEKDLKAAFDEYKPELIEHYKKTVRASFGRVVQFFGDNVEGAANSGHPVAYEWRNLVRMSCKSEKIEGAPLLHSRRYMIDEPLLEKNAQDYADMMLDKWRIKVERKVGELVGDVELDRLPYYEFRITGMANGRKVVIRQSMIVNFSKHGIPFNQFPALIYIDGKKVSSEEFEKAAGLKTPEHEALKQIMVEMSDAALDDAKSNSKRATEENGRKVRLPGADLRSVNGHGVLCKVEATGYGFHTGYKACWYVDGRKVAKAKVAEIVGPVVEMKEDLADQLDKAETFGDVKVVFNKAFGE